MEELEKNFSLFISKFRTNKLPNIMLQPWADGWLLHLADTNGHVKQTIGAGTFDSLLEEYEKSKK